MPLQQPIGERVARVARSRAEVSAELKQIEGAPCVKIMIQDNGCGFEPQSLAWKQGHGLANVFERLALASREATFSLSSQLDRGTCIVIEIPLLSASATPGATASTERVMPDASSGPFG
jgi:signal transduction histidine kinase